MTRPASKNEPKRMSQNFLEALEANAQLAAKPRNLASLAGQVRLRLPDIEIALARGFTHRQILQQLNQDGLDLTAAYYHRLIPKLRSEARAAGEMPLDRRVQGLIVPSARNTTAIALVPPADPLRADQAPAEVVSDTNNDNLSSAFAAHSVMKPRTILSRKSDGPKFTWDAKGAEKFDPNNL
jgi:hypothetical protein